ncbi:MAG: hypothetical protein ACYC7E_04165 [Armatimonadota bacterium]
MQKLQALIQFIALFLGGMVGAVILGCLTELVMWETPLGIVGLVVGPSAITPVGIVIGTAFGYIAASNIAQIQQTAWKVFLYSFTSLIILLPLNLYVMTTTPIPSGHEFDESIHFLFSMDLPFIFIGSVIATIFISTFHYLSNYWSGKRVIPVVHSGAEVAFLIIGTLIMSGFGMAISIAIGHITVDAGLDNLGKILIFSTGIGIFVGCMSGIWLLSRWIGIKGNYIRALKVIAGMTIISIPLQFSGYFFYIAPIIAVIAFLWKSSPVASPDIESNIIDGHQRGASEESPKMDRKLPGGNP